MYSKRYVKGLFEQEVLLKNKTTESSSSFRVSVSKARLGDDCYNYLISLPSLTRVSELSRLAYLGFLASQSGVSLSVKNKQSDIASQKKAVTKRPPIVTWIGENLQCQK